MHLGIIKNFWLIIHSEKRLGGTLFLQVLVLTLTMVLSIQYFGIHQFKVRESIIPEYSHLYTYGKNTIGKEEITSLTNMQNLSAFAITLSEGIGENAEYPVVAQFGEIGLTKIYGNAITELDNESASPVIVAPREYMILKDKEIGDTVSYSGIEFEIIGQNDGYPWNAFLMPYTLVAEQNLQVISIDCYFPLAVSEQEYQGYIDLLSKLFSCDVSAEDYDEEVGMISSKYIVESLLIFALGATNIIFIQQHVQEMKRRFFSVMFLTGMNQNRFYQMLILEAGAIFGLSFALAALTLLGIQSLYFMMNTESLMYLYPEDYVRFLGLYLVGFIAVTLIANARLSKQPRIRLYKESGR